MLTDDELRERLEIYKRLGNNGEATARELGMDGSVMRYTLKIAAQRGLLLDHAPAMPGFRISQVSEIEREDKDGNVSRAKSIQQRPEHGEVFEIPAGLKLKGVTALVDSDGRVMHKHVMAREDTSQAPDLVAAIHQEFSQYKGFAKLTPPPGETCTDLCNYYPIVDPHIGMLSYGRETGQSNDLKIGTERVEGTLQRLIGWSPPAETAVIINTGDFFHADNQRNITEASGHQLDVDGRNQKVKWVGVNMLRTTIDFALQRHKRVVVKNLKGNHDGDSAMWLNIALGMFYSNEPRVEIDPADGNNDHFFHLFGVNYVGATHGHTMKPDRMYVMMAEDNPEYWNASLYRWCIFGHIHQETKKQIGSLICESFSQPVPRDSFAHSHGYRSGNAMQSITLHRTGGELSRLRQNFPPSRGKSAADALAI
jgi:predicted phosphodiesterase